MFMGWGCGPAALSLSGPLLSSLQIFALSPAQNPAVPRLCYCAIPNAVKLSPRVWSHVLLLLPQRLRKAPERRPMIPQKRPGVLTLCRDGQYTLERETVHQPHF